MQVKKILSGFICLVQFQSLNSQVIYHPSAVIYPEAVALTPKFTDAFTCAYYPAALPQLSGWKATIYSEKKYSTDGLINTAVALAYGKNTAGAAFFFNYFGNTGFNEMQASVSYGKMLGDVNAGISFNYNSYYVEGYNRQTIFCLSFSTLWKLSENVYAGFQLFNPPFARINSIAVAQASKYNVLFGYEASEAAGISFQFLKSEDTPLQVTISFHYQANKKVFIKAGFFTGGPQPFIGIGWKIKNIKVETALTYHPALGSTPGISITRQ